MRWIAWFTLISLYTLMPWNHLSAQTDPDTLEMAKELRNSGQLSEALALLEPYQAAHPADLNAAWIYAQTAYWAGKTNLSRTIYEQAIRNHPDNLYLQFDYATMLVNLGKFSQAGPYLENFLTAYPDNPQALLITAKMKFWEGKYKDAFETASALVKADPANQEAVSLQQETRKVKSPWIGISGSYYTDNQPLDKIGPVLESNIWLHPLSTLRLSLRTPLFSQGGAWTNALWLQAGNSAFLWRGNWTLITDAGILQYPYKNTLTWTANFELGKRSLRHLVTTFQAERKPYLATGSSIDTVINEYHVAETIRWDNFNSWNGQVSYNWDYFLSDYNSIYAFAAWGLAPPLKASVFDFRLGYGFSYSNAAKDRYEPAGKKEDIIANYDSAAGIEGIYYPYFTPSHQMINSAILSIGIHPAKGFDMGISGNVGFYATARIPYLYLDTNGVGTVVIKKGFSEERYYPYTISAFASIQFSKKISIRADYSFNSTYFYTNNYLGLQLKINIWSRKPGS